MQNIEFGEHIDDSCALKSYHMCLGVNTVMSTVSFQSEHTVCFLEVEQMQYFYILVFLGVF